MIASDGFIENGRGHPRTSGTYAKVLGKYVREEKALTLMDALRKMTIEPARRLEARVPSMATKGRIKRRRRCRPDDLRSGDGDRQVDVRGRDDSVRGNSVRDRGRAGRGGQRAGHRARPGRADSSASPMSVVMHRSCRRAGVAALGVSARPTPSVPPRPSGCGRPRATDSSWTFAPTPSRASRSRRSRASRRCARQRRTAAGAIDCVHAA